METTYLINSRPFARIDGLIIYRHIFDLHEEREKKGMRLKDIYRRELVLVSNQNEPSAFRQRTEERSGKLYVQHGSFVDDHRIACQRPRWKNRESGIQRGSQSRSRL